MFRTICSSIKYSSLWAGTADAPSRWRRLDQLDRFLDGTLYDHLIYDFYCETRPGSEEIIPLLERRPSSQYNLPGMVARWSARKLWAGRLSVVPLECLICWLRWRTEQHRWLADMCRDVRWALSVGLG